MPPVVVLDACVLYPAAQRDLFMWLAAGGVVRAHWTHQIHDEWMRNVARDYGVSRRILEHVRRLSRKELARRLAQLEARTDARFKAVFDALRDLMTPAEPKRRPIGIVYPKEK